MIRGVRYWFPANALEQCYLWDEYVKTFRSKMGKTDWDFIIREVYGNFIDLSISSDID